MPSPAPLTDTSVENSLYPLDNEADEPDPAALDDPELVSLEQEAEAEIHPVKTTNALLQGETDTMDPLMLFLNQAARYDLLTAGQEVELAKRIEKGVAAKALHEELETRKRNDPYARIFLGISEAVAKAQARDGREAKQAMINSNLRLVVNLAKRYQNPEMPLLDLIQEGVIGLNRAVEKFDWRKGFKFSTYATWWIRQALQRGLSNKSRIIKLPIHIVERQQKLKSAERELTASLGHSPTKEEIAKHARISLKQAHEVWDAGHASTSFDKPIGDDGDNTIGGMYAVVEPGTDEVVADNMRAQDVRRIVDTLPDDERAVIISHFGLGGQSPQTLDAIGLANNLTSATVRRLKASALKRLSGLPAIKALSEG